MGLPLQTFLNLSVGAGWGPMPVEDAMWDAFHIGFASTQQTRCAVNLM